MIWVIRNSRLGDQRGWFTESFSQRRFEEAGISTRFVQDNHSRSSLGVVRGLHFAVGAGCSKLVRCGRGKIWDVIVDLREGSPSYGRWEGFELSDSNMQVLYVPVGFAHGFCVLSDVADVIYKQSDYFSSEVERGIAWDDPEVGVVWPLPLEQLVVSERDSSAPKLSDIADSLPFKIG